MLNVSGMPQAKPGAVTVENNGFYPDLDTAEFCQAYSIPTQYSQETTTVVDALARAAIEVNQSLAYFWAENWATYTLLAHVPSGKVAGTSNLTRLYKTAVYSLAKSKLLVTRLDQTNRDVAAGQVNQKIDNGQYWAAQSQTALRQLTGGPSGLSVELI